MIKNFICIQNFAKCLICVYACLSTSLILAGMDDYSDEDIEYYDRLVGEMVEACFEPSKPLEGYLATDLLSALDLNEEYEKHEDFSADKVENCGLSQDFRTYIDVDESTHDQHCEAKCQEIDTATLPPHLQPLDSNSEDFLQPCEEKYSNLFESTFNKFLEHHRRAKIKNYTKMPCKSVIYNRVCIHGKNCTYAHQIHELDDLNIYQSYCKKQENCPFLNSILSGGNGVSRCRFAHTPEEKEYGKLIKYYRETLRKQNESI